MKGMLWKERGSWVREFQGSRVSSGELWNVETMERWNWFAPCAGITLIRFCGFDLSLPAIGGKSTPVTLKIFDAPNVPEECFGGL